MTPSPKRTSAVDPLRLILAAFVVGIHTNYGFGLDAPFSDMLVNGLYRIAVPTFAVISGYFFFDAMQRDGGVLYIKRILFLFAIWTLIYLPLWIGLQDEPQDIIKVAIFGVMHLWFLPGIAIAAGMMMIMKARGVKNSVILILALCLAVSGCIAQYLSMRTGTISIYFYRNGIFSIYPYFAIGWLLNSPSVQLGLGRVPAALRIGAVITALIAVMIEGALWMDIEGAKSVDNMVSLVFAAPVVFLAALGTTGSWPGKTLAQIATFVYLSHYLFIDAAERLLGGTAAEVPFVFLASFGLGWALTALPTGRRILKSAT
ncbi:acyltransferase family protein [uncultured Paracoccus sp.]|uniref:acyltransferase n=1 Tax=uncultured Paracoccus sp. TaxID=189685 RepID=UPI0025DFF19A|nr:acyltransferase family protein [uncultured Paracoccus sp.]